MKDVHDTKNQELQKISVLAGLFKTGIFSDRNTKWIKKQPDFKSAFFGSGTYRRRATAEKDRDAGTSRTAGHCQLRELLFLWQQLSAFYQRGFPHRIAPPCRSKSGSEWSPQQRQYIHPKEINWPFCSPRPPLQQAPGGSPAGPEQKQ